MQVAPDVIVCPVCEKRKSDSPEERLAREDCFVKIPADPLDPFAKIDRWLLDAAIYGGTALVLVTMMLITFGAGAMLVAFGMRLAAS